MSAEPSYLISLGRRILRLLSGVIIAVILLLVFERIYLIDALLVIAAGAGVSFFLLRREGRAIGSLALCIGIRCCKAPRWHLRILQ